MRSFRKFWQFSIANVKTCFLDGGLGAPHQILDRGVVVITTEQLASTKPELDSA